MIATLITNMHKNTQEVRNINQKCFNFLSLLFELVYHPTPTLNPLNHLTCHWSCPQHQTSQWLHLQRLGALSGYRTRPHALTNSWSLYVGYSGITLLLQTQTILPQLMFWSTMCRLKSLNYMTRQIKADHRIWSAQVGCDSLSKDKPEIFLLPQ